MRDATTTVIIAVLGSNALFAFIQFMISRHDSKDGDKFDKIAKELNYVKKDVLRTQLLLLILIKPEETQEIMTIAEHYFAELHGNWYMTSIFNKWLEQEVIAEPEWFDNKK